MSDYHVYQLDEVIEAERDENYLCTGWVAREDAKHIAIQRDQLREALERLTSACERNHKTIYMGTTHDRYDMAYERGGEDPVKLARAALANTGEPND